jgi:hypothetical protein
MSLSFTLVKERARTWRDVAMALKSTIDEPFERLVLQRAIDNAHAVIPHGTAAELTAATENLKAVVRTYRPPSPAPASVVVLRPKTIAARTRAALEASRNRKETA